VECKIYLLFLLLVWVWRRIGVARATAIFTFAAYVLAWLAHGTARASMSPHYLAMFCWGAAAAWVSNTPANTPTRGWLWIRDTRAWNVAACASLVMLTALCLRWGHVPSRMFVLDIFAGMIATAMRVIAARTKVNPLRRVLGVRALTGVGEYSYSLYLIHAPLLQVVWQYGAVLLFRDPVPRFVLTVAGGIPLILLVSRIFYRYCE
jgi:peptidoglycan/LPS O-acetylase OafA/YrhL